MHSKCTGSTRPASEECATFYRQGLKRQLNPHCSTRRTGTNMTKLPADVLYVMEEFPTCISLTAGRFTLEEERAILGLTHWDNTCSQRQLREEITTASRSVRGMPRSIRLEKNTPGGVAISSHSVQILFSDLKQPVWRSVNSKHIIRYLIELKLKFLK